VLCYCRHGASSSLWKAKDCAEIVDLQSGHEHSTSSISLSSDYGCWAGFTK